MRDERRRRQQGCVPQRQCHRPRPTHARLVVQRATSIPRAGTSRVRRRASRAPAAEPERVTGPRQAVAVTRRTARRTPTVRFSSGHRGRGRRRPRDDARSVRHRRAPARPVRTPSRPACARRPTAPRSRRERRHSRAGRGTGDCPGGGETPHDGPVVARPPPTDRRGGPGAPAKRRRPTLRLADDVREHEPRRGRRGRRPAGPRTWHRRCSECSRRPASATAHAATVTHSREPAGDDPRPRARPGRLPPAARGQPASRAGRRRRSVVRTCVEPPVCGQPHTSTRHENVIRRGRLPEVSRDDLVAERARTYRAVRLHCRDPGRETAAVPASAGTRPCAQPVWCVSPAAGCAGRTA